MERRHLLRRIHKVEGCSNLVHFPPPSCPEEAELFHRLTRFKNDSSKELNFPPTLAAKQRAYVHSAAGSQGWSHESQGKGKDRFIRVEKTATAGGEASAVEQDHFFSRGYVGMTGPSINALGVEALLNPDSGYYGAEGFSVPRTHIDQRQKRDGAHFHITIVNKYEMQGLSPLDQSSALLPLPATTSVTNGSEWENQISHSTKLAVGGDQPMGSTDTTSLRVENTIEISKTTSISSAHSSAPIFVQHQHATIHTTTTVSQTSTETTSSEHTECKASGKASESVQEGDWAAASPGKRKSPTRSPTRTSKEPIGEDPKVEKLLELCAQHIEDDWSVVGIGRLSKTGREAFFLVVDWPSANRFREEVLQLPAKDFHVTLGFNPTDIHDSVKDITTVFAFRKEQEASA